MLQKIHSKSRGINKNVDITDKDGFTALYYALTKNHKESRDFLYSCGASWNNFPKEILVRNESIWDVLFNIVIKLALYFFDNHFLFHFRKHGGLNTHKKEKWIP